MSQENVEIVRAFVRGLILHEHDEWQTYVDPAFVWNPTEQGATEGIEALVETMTAWESTWDEYSVTPEGFVDMGDRVVAILDFHGRGRGSGIEAEARFYEVYTVRDGKLVRMDEFLDRSEALEAAGPRKSALSHENVDVVRSTLEAWGALADTGELVDRFWDPDADYYPVRKFPEARACHGRDEIAQFQADYLSAWDRYEAVINDLIAVGDDRVLAHTTVRGEGRESGVKLDGDLYHCFWLRHQRIFRVEDHLTLTGALRALGLSGDSLEAAGLRE